MGVYYHYSNREGIKGIVKSKRIRKSPGGRHGPGVYFTTMAPSYGRLKVSKNNWDGAGPDAELRGKTDYCISVQLPESRVRRFQNRDGTDIHLYDDDVDLTQTVWELFSKNGDHTEFLESDSSCSVM